MFSNIKAFFTVPGTGMRAPLRVFWVALLVRTLYITLAHTYRVGPILGHFQFGWEVGRIARALATGYGYSDPFNGHTGPTAWIAPLYPLLLAGVFKVFGVYTPLSAWVILVINSVFSAATAVAVYEIAARCYDNYGHGRRIALWSAWLWALYPAAMQYAVRWIWDMALATFLFAWILVLALRVRGIGKPSVAPASRHTVSRWLLFGLLWGLIALSNPSLLLVFPACVVWMLWDLRFTSRTLLPAALKAILACIVLFACLAPWAWRNWNAFHAFIPTRGNLGAELYQSSLKEKNGFTWGQVVSLAETNPDTIRYKAIGEAAWVKEKGAIAKANMKQYPGLIAQWTLKRVYFFWAGVPHPFEGSPLVEITREVNFGFLSVTGILGLLLSIQRRVPGGWLFAAVFLLEPLIYYAVTSQARFRHPLEPLITIFTVFLFQSAERPSHSVAPLHD